MADAAWYEDSELADALGLIAHTSGAAFILTADGAVAVSRCSIGGVDLLGAARAAIASRVVEKIPAAPGYFHDLFFDVCDGEMTYRATLTTYSLSTEWLLAILEHPDMKPPTTGPARQALNEISQIFELRQLDPVPFIPPTPSSSGGSGAEAHATIPRLGKPEN
jgi:hypothetical protein